MHLLRRNLLCKEKEKKISHVKVHDVCTAQKQLECFVLPSINFLIRAMGNWDPSSEGGQAS